MKIEHIAMYVNELESARDFFVKYLGGVSNDEYNIKRMILKEDIETPF